jgi:hypothetical protein
MRKGGRAEGSARDQRRSFRIDDEVLLQYEEIDSDGVTPTDQRSARLGSPAFVVCSRLAEQRRQLQVCLREVQQAVPPVAKYLRLLDDKVDTLASILVLKEIDELSGSKQQVKLSATGMVFHTKSELPEQTMLVIQMVLLPSFTGVITEAQVIRSTRFVSERPRRFLTTVEFVKMRESTRDLIAKHILDRQKDRARLARKVRTAGTEGD